MNSRQNKVQMRTNNIYDKINLHLSKYKSKYSVFVNAVLYINTKDYDAYNIKNFIFKYVN